MPLGSLTIVGTGIQLVGGLTLAAQGWIEQADKVLFAGAYGFMPYFMGIRAFSPIRRTKPFDRLGAKGLT